MLVAAAPFKCGVWAIVLAPRALGQVFLYADAYAEGAFVDDPQLVGLSFPMYMDTRSVFQKGF
eukprot:515126-Lingulodinium_polyedra.AAC.1